MAHNLRRSYSGPSNRFQLEILKQLEEENLNGANNEIIDEIKKQLGMQFKFNIGGINIQGPGNSAKHVKNRGRLQDKNHNALHDKNRSALHDTNRDKNGMQLAKKRLHLDCATCTCTHKKYRSGISFSGALKDYFEVENDHENCDGAGPSNTLARGDRANESSAETDEATNCLLDISHESNNSNTSDELNGTESDEKNEDTNNVSTCVQ